MQSLPSIGSVIDETYEIKSLLGKGGFGAVFLARHIPMEREVALKLLLANGHNPQEMVQRFRREVMAIRNLSHPNTVRIFDYRDSDEDTLIYYTMEYLRGETLKDVVRGGGPQAPRRVRHILKQILKSLAEAHALGIVHRDLKPANIMLVQMYGEEDFVKVLDFGIAKIMEQEDDEDEPLTSAGMLVGTLRYMSPEQIKGLPLGPYTDIYALGLIALEMIMGKSVFAGTGRWEILQKQVSAEPIEFPPELLHSPMYDILQKMLVKDSTHRYPNAEVLLRDLNSIPETALSDQPLINARASLPPLPGQSAHSSASNISRISAPSTPPPSPFEETPTTISELNIAAPQRVPVGGPPIPVGFDTPSMTPQPASHSNTFPDHSESSQSNEAPFIVSKPASKAPLFVGIGIVLFIALAGAAFALSSSDEETEPPTPHKEDAVVAVTPPPQDTPPETTTTTTPSEDPAEPEPATPRMVKLVLDPSMRDTAAVAFLGDKELGTLPLDYALEEGDAPVVTIKAERFETSTVTLNADTPDTLPLTLVAIPKKSVRKKDPVKKKPIKKAPKKTTKKKDSSDWADITAKPKKPPVIAFE